jgi:hypothetical protein
MKNDDEIMLAGSDSAGRSSRSESSESGISQSLSNQMLDEMIRNSKNATNGGSSDQSGTIRNEMKKVAEASDSQSNASSDGNSKLQKQKDGSAGSEAQRQKDSAGEGRDSVEKGVIERGRKAEWHLKTGKDGVETLPTGDKLVQDGDREILFMPNGDKLSVNKDGSFDLKSKGGVEVKKQGDQTTVKFANGDEVTFSKNGITSVTRDGRTVNLLSTKDIINSIKDRSDLYPHVKPGGGSSEKESLPNKMDNHHRPDKGGEEQSKPMHNLNRPDTGAPLDQPKRFEK